MSSSRLVVLASLLAAAASVACGGNSNPATDGGSDANTVKDSGPKKDANLPKDDASTPDDDGGTTTGPTIDPQCTVPALASAGSCSPALDDAGINCNVVTNAGCDVDAGEACDFDNGGGLTCFPAPNTQTICQKCDLANGPQCMGGLHCVDTPNGGQCAQVCCTDADCTPGHCDTTTLQSDPVGFCVK